MIKVLLISAGLAAVSIGIMVVGFQFMKIRYVVS